ncbi:MAG TPA: RICIN domain-containing protein [Steroidobacteraceae bacterium]|nr:RICIN domain-containing protein [Steroidobacteraceae bacterium]
MKLLHGLYAAAALSCLASVASAQTELQTYVQRCQTELQFQAAEVKPMDCNTGARFALGGKTPVNDFVVSSRVNANVDMVAACRWGNGGPDPDENAHNPYNNMTKALSIELLIHNRANGGTCFFAAKDQDSTTKPVSTKIVSPTNFSTLPANLPNANNFWLPPSDLNNKMLFSDGNSGMTGFSEKLQCVRCHSQGPYVISARIAPYMANLGLINDGHDTYSNFAALAHYFVVGSREHTQTDPGTHPFGNWNNLIFTHNRTGGCSSSCHVLAKEETERFFSPIGSLTSPVDAATVVLPSIVADIRELRGNGMEPAAEDSPYKWINADEPTADGVEVETFTSAKRKFPVTGYCGVPTVLEANAVRTDAVFRSIDVVNMPNKLRAFNLRDGLTCLNSDQPGGARCYDHQVSYKCDGPNPVWTPYYNKDTSNTDDGDHEERSKAWAEARAFCGNKDPVAMRAQVLANGIPMYQATAPTDRLAQLSPSGLVCRNSDQGSGQTCSNYTVRYRGCRSDANLAKMKSAWTNAPTFGDRYLTTTNNVDGAETKAQGNNYQYPSQDWIIEPVAGGNTVRLADVWSGKYLTASSNNDLAVVQVKNSDSSQMRQQWVRETIVGSTEVRFRNVGSGRYLTVGNYTSDPYYAPIVTQSLSNQNWASQRWVVQ